MAHELSINAEGKAEAMFAGEKPWHGLGTMVDGLKTPEQALDLASLRWTADRAPLYLHGPTKPLQIPDKDAIIRSDTGAYLGTVGKHWVPVQNEEQAEFIAALTGTGEAVVECAGALRGGKRIFWTCKMPGTVKVTDGDEIEKYLILANGHDGHLAFRAFWSPIRVVCMNTLNAALDGVKEGVVVYHRLDAKHRVEQARKILGIAGGYYSKLGETFKQMLAVSIGEAGFKSYLEEVFPIELEEGKKPTKATIRARALVTENFQHGRGSEIAGQTVWGAYNAVTEFLDHQKQNGSKEESAEERLASKFEAVLLGGSKDVQQKAFNAALALV